MTPNIPLIRTAAHLDHTTAAAAQAARNLAHAFDAPADTRDLLHAVWLDAWAAEVAATEAWADAREVAS